MQDMIKFSVLMSIYYKERPEYLIQCLESLEKQTLPATEIIIIKDGTLTRDLEQILFVWQKRLPIEIVGYEENKGLAYALNYGLQFCSYELVARMDSDDICMIVRFEKQINYLKEHINIDIVGSNILEFYEDDNKIVHNWERSYPIFTNKNSKSLFMGTPIAHPSVIIRTEILKKYQYNNKFFNEDIDLWFRLLLDGYSITNINEPLIKYRITNKTFERRNLKKALSEFKIYWQNLYKIHGFSLLLIFPCLRFVSRLMPRFYMKKIYLSKKRNIILR